MLSYATLYAQFPRAVEGCPESTKQTIYTRVAAAKSRMNLQIREILRECDARSEMHSRKDSNFQKTSSQSCRDFHAVCKNAQILSYVTT